MSRDDKKRKKARKERNRAAAPTPSQAARDRWQGSASFQLGKDPRTKLDLEWSGVRVSVDGPGDTEGALELTRLTLEGGDPN